MLVWSFLLLAVLAGAERQVLEQVNRHRTAAGLGLLAWNETAAQEARRHCGRLLEGKAREPHEGFAERAERLRRATGRRRTGENIFLLESGPFLAEKAVEAWLSSNGHRHTIEGPFESSGVGVVRLGRKACAAQIFLGR